MRARFTVGRRASGVGRRAGVPLRALVHQHYRQRWRCCSPSAPGAPLLEAFKPWLMERLGAMFQDGATLGTGLSKDAIDQCRAAMDSASPAQGGRSVARAWLDPAYRERLLQDGTKAAEEMGIAYTR